LRACAPQLMIRRIHVDPHPKVPAAGAL
jgi:hypothetical protein